MGTGQRWKKIRVNGDRLRLRWQSEDKRGKNMKRKMGKRMKIKTETHEREKEIGVRQGLG